MQHATVHHHHHHRRSEEHTRPHHTKLLVLTLLCDGSKRETRLLVGCEWDESVWSGSRMKGVRVEVL